MRFVDVAEGLVDGQLQRAGVGAVGGEVPGPFGVELGPLLGCRFPVAVGVDRVTGGPVVVVLGGVDEQRNLELLA